MNIFKRLISAVQKEENETHKAHSKDRIATQELTNKFIADPEFPFLVSFSRTGSHWLRMLMELYFEKPSLKLLFFQTVEETQEYTCFHTHDLDLKVEAKNVVYLYRDPVDTIFSQMTFHSQDLDNKEILNGWIELYANHLNKWLYTEKFTGRKVVLTYEGMRSDLEGEFRKLSSFFGVTFDAQKLSAVASKVSKEAIKEKTGHDPRVINLNKDYPATREKFRAKYANEIYSKTFELFPQLKSQFSTPHGTH